MQPGNPVPRSLKPSLDTIKPEIPFKGCLKGWGFKTSMYIHAGANVHMKTEVQGYSCCVFFPFCRLSWEWKAVHVEGCKNKRNRLLVINKNALSTYEWARWLLLQYSLGSVIRLLWWWGFVHSNLLRLMAEVRLHRVNQWNEFPCVFVTPGFKVRG